MEVPDGWRRAHPKQPPDGPDGCRTHQHSSSGLKSTTAGCRGGSLAWIAPGGCYIKRQVRDPIWCTPGSDRLYGGWMKLSRIKLFREGTHNMRGRTCHHPPPSRSRAAHCALRDREGFSRIGRRSLEIIVPPTLTTGALCPTRTTMVSHGADAGTPSGRGCHLQGRSSPSSWIIM